MAFTSTLTPDTKDAQIPQLMFSWLDYTIFAGMMGMSALIGIYFGFFGTKQNTTKEYLLGGKTMKVLPVALSLIASDISGMALLTVPADVYKNGGTYWWICFSIVINCVMGCYVFIPVFIKLQVTSVFEYLSMRFDKKIRTLASFLFTLAVLLYNPIVIYVPALAFSQVAGLGVHLITPIACIVCIFYTTIGGLKAVVWTDTLQTASIAISMAIVFCIGLVSAGGFSAVWNKSVEGHRLDVFTFDVNPIRRDSSWAIIIGSTANWLCNFSIHQGTIQRILSVPSARHANRVIFISCIGVTLVTILSTFTGLIIFTKYSDCDPLSTKQIRRSDQLLPYYVMDVAGNIPGLPGLFIAGIFSASLSTLSTTLNTLAATIYEDFLSPFMPANITQKRTSNILKLIVLLAGIACIALVYVVEQLGAALPLSFTISGITRGPLLGLFCLGMLFPVANSKGALCGGVGSLVFCSWIIIGSQWYKRKGMLEDFSKPISTEGCNFYVNLTSQKRFSPSLDDQPLVLYRISFWWFTFLGAVVTVVIGLIVSWLTSKNDPPVHPDLISPVTQFLLPKQKTAATPHNYYSVDKALQIVTLNSDKEHEVHSESSVVTNKQ